MTRQSISYINQETYIYGLFCPKTEKIFYIGRSARPLKERLTNHIKDVKLGKQTPKAKYIKNLMWLGYKPSIVLLHTFIAATKREAIDTEQAFIDFFSIKHNLTNSADASSGGDINPTKVDWNADVIARLGTVPDHVLAAELGCAVSTVDGIRRRLKIKSWAVQTGYTPPIAGWNKFDFPDWVYSELGKVHDSVIAKKLGLDKSTVGRFRTELGIPTYKESEHKRLEELIKPYLNKFNDCDIARIVNESNDRVRNTRIRLGAPKYKGCSLTNQDAS